MFPERRLGFEVDLVAQVRVSGTYDVNIYPFPFRGRRSVTFEGEDLQSEPETRVKEELDELKDFVI